MLYLPIVRFPVCAEVYYNLHKYTKVENNKNNLSIVRILNFLRIRNTSYILHCLVSRLCLLHSLQGTSSHKGAVLSERKVRSRKRKANYITPLRRKKS